MSLKNDTSNEILALLRFARAYCAEKLPWFAPALFRCRMHLTERIPVAAIDPHYNVYFNPQAIRKMNIGKTRADALSQIGFLWIHEISHLLREHRQRALERSADPWLWNIACDLEINDSHWQGLEVPVDFPPLMPDMYRLPNGQLAEFYYGKIVKKLPEKLFSRIVVVPGFSAKDMVDEGSGVHGQARPWELEPAEPQRLDDIEAELVRRSVAHEIQKTIKSGADIGRIPAGWVRWADITLKPKVDWKKVLRHRMSIAINNGVGNRIDYSRSRPSRRQTVYDPVLVPVLSGDLSARVMVVIDTSGSMHETQIGQAVAEVFKILNSFQTPVTVIPCDDEAYDAIRVRTPSDFFKMRQLKGGGGTNMVAGIEAALLTKPKPDSILVLTDGFTPYPEKKYKTNVVFGILHFGETDLGNRPPNPPWGADSVVEIDVSNVP